MELNKVDVHKSYNVLRVTSPHRLGGMGLHHGGRSWSGPDPKGGGTPPPLRNPKLSHGTRCFVGAGGAGDFVSGLRQGEFFLFHPMCLYSKYSQFCGEFKNG